MRATWDPTASLLHGHTAITSTAATERERGTGEGGGDEKETSEAATEGSDLYIWEQRDTKKHCATAHFVSSLL